MFDIDPVLQYFYFIVKTCNCRVARSINFFLILNKFIESRNNLTTHRCHAARRSTITPIYVDDVESFDLVSASISGCFSSGVFPASALEVRLAAFWRPSQSFAACPGSKQASWANLRTSTSVQFKRTWRSSHPRSR